MAVTPFRLHNAATSVGTGLSVPTYQDDVVSFQILGTFVGTITFQGTVDGVHWVDIMAENTTTLIMSTTATVPGIWRAHCTNYRSARANITSYTSGSITVWGAANESDDWRLDEPPTFEGSKTITGQILGADGLPWWVLNLGAVPYSATSGSDITDVFQEALDTGAKFVYVPAGNYEISSEITVPEGVVLFGAGMGLTIFTATTVGVDQAALKATGDHTRFHDFTLVGPSSATYVANEIGIELLGTNNTTRLSGGQIERVEVSNFGSEGIRAYYADDVVITRNYVHDCGYAGIAVYSCDFPRVTYNRVETIYPGAQGNGYGITFSAFTGDTPPVGFICDNNIVSDVWFWELLDTHGGTDGSFCNNYLYNGRMGIAIGPASGSDCPHRINVANNHIKKGSLGPTGTITAVDTAANTLSITAHGWQTGWPIMVSSSSASLPAPLAAAALYYVIWVDANTIKLATTFANAIGNTAIDLTTTGGGVLTAFIAVSRGIHAGGYGVTISSVNTGADSITATDHGFSTGRAVQIMSQGTVPGGLTEHVTYYVIRLTSSTFQLATTAANAAAGTFIDITSAGSGTIAVADMSTGITINDNVIDSMGDVVSLSAAVMIQYCEGQVLANNTIMNSFSKAIVNATQVYDWIITGNVISGIVVGGIGRDCGIQFNIAGTTGLFSSNYIDASATYCADISVAIPGVEWGKNTYVTSNATKVLNAANAGPGMELAGSDSYTPGTIVDGTAVTKNVTVVGTVLGDYVRASFNLDLQGVTLHPWVSAVNTVSVRFQNRTGGDVTLGAGTINAIIQRP